MPKPKPAAPDAEALLKENLRLQRAVEELSILNELSRTISGSLNLEEIIHNIIKRSLRVVHAEQGNITLVDRHRPSSMKTLVRTMASSSVRQPYHLNQSLLGWMLHHMRPLTINDPATDQRFRGVNWEESVRTLLCVPMMVKSELIGILTVYNKRNGDGFTEEDQRLLTIIAGQSAQVVENARLYEEEKALMRMQEELRLAYDIQIKLLPKQAPVVQGYDIAGKSIPAENVGGDYYDFIRMDEKRLAVCLGDITGKGMPAALLMANLQATIRSQTLASETCCDCISRANRLLFDSTDQEKFATLFYGILNHEEHKICYCNAGHNFPLLFSSAGEPMPLKTGGVMIGILENVPFQQETIPLQPDNLLVVYSDGVTEAINEMEEEFGEARLMDVITSNRHVTCTELIEKIVQAVREFTGRMPQSDDITIMAVRRSG